MSSCHVFISFTTVNALRYPQEKNLKLRNQTKGPPQTPPLTLVTNLQEQGNSPVYAALSVNSMVGLLLVTANIWLGEPAATDGELRASSVRS